MDHFVARQPVFDRHMKTIAYSLYYRRPGEHIASSKGDEATASVLLNGPLMAGYEKLTDHKPAVIKFTASLLLNETALLLHPENMIIELVEPVTSEELMDAIIRLKSYGYKIAINSSLSLASIEAILDHIDIISIDFSSNGLETVKDFLVLTTGSKATLMAFKVETQEQYEFAKSLNFEWFQGNFFMKPSLVKSKVIKAFSKTYMLLMAALKEDEPDFVQISNIIASDLALTYGVLRLVNSSAFSGKQKITDLHQAIVRIGSKELCKWLFLVMIQDMCKGRPSIYAKTSVIRGKAMENLADRSSKLPKREQLFLTGVLSMIHLILEMPKEEILAKLPLDAEVIEGLITGQNLHGRVLEIITAYEQMTNDRLDKEPLESLDLKEADIISSYLKAIEWSKDI